MYPVLGLSDEAGKVLGKFKKFFRDKSGKYTDEFKSDIKKIGWCFMVYIRNIYTIRNPIIKDCPRIVEVYS